jgi:hypothetical protein
MKKITLVILCLLFSVTSHYGQDLSVQRDTTAMPKLEIPEITIVGKKAITLPFARKGEVYDISLYEVPSPDTTLLEPRIAMSLPLGPLPRYEEPLIPWHFSAEGSFGSFSAGNLRLYGDYKGSRWGVYGNGSFSTTNGHTNHAEGSSFDLNLTAHSIVNTDNSILNSFRLLSGIGMMFDKYGMFGLKQASVDRSRDNINIHAGISSLEREKSSYDISLSADIWSILDRRAPADSSITVMSPELKAGYSVEISRFRFNAGLLYTGTSLNYDRATESPSLLGLNAGIRWQATKKWSVELGGQLHDGSGSDGNGRTLVSPYVIGRFEIDKDRQFSVWTRPGMQLQSYGSQSQLNPYLYREVVLRPESVPLNIGGGFWFNGEVLSLEVNGEFSKINDKTVTVADSGYLHFAYIDAVQALVNVHGTFAPLKYFRLVFSGVIQPTYEEDQSVQLPMIPLVKTAARGEVTLPVPITMWLSLEYWSKQNINFNRSDDIGARFLVGLGALTTIIPRTVLSAEINNLLDDNYEWWSNYRAPGISFRLNAKVNFR